jgi:hypothetical protein
LFLLVYFFFSVFLFYLLEVCHIFIFSGTISHNKLSADLKV